MKKFSQFIVESVEVNDIASMKSVSKYMDERDRTRYLSALDKFFAAYQAKSIYNADFGELYSYDLSRSLENAWEKLYYPLIQKFRGDDDKFRTITADGIFSINSIAKMLRYHEKNTKAFAPELTEFLKSLEKLQPFIKELKTYIIKGRKPKPVDPNAYVKPMVPYEAKKKAIEFLNSAVDAIRNQYYQSMYESFKKDADEIEKIMISVDHKRGDFGKKIGQNQNYLIIAQAIYKSEGYTMNAVMKRSPNYETILRNSAKRQADEIIDAFVYKNSEKLGHIFAKKSKIDEHKILYNRVRGRNLENSMSFKFDDNSSFIIYTSTVYGYTQRGTVFVKYPTRFTNVIMKDGSKMSMPAEKKMIEDF